MAGSLSFGSGSAKCEHRLGGGGRCGGTAFWIEADGTVVCQECYAKHRPSWFAGVVWETRGRDRIAKAKEKP